MDFITNTHGNTVPHDGGRGFCGAQVFPQKSISISPVGRTWTSPRCCCFPLLFSASFAVSRSLLSQKANCAYWQRALLLRDECGIL